MLSAQQGVTTVIPTVSARAVDKLIVAIKDIVARKKQGARGANIGGIHLLRFN